MLCSRGEALKTLATLCTTTGRHLEASLHCTVYSRQHITSFIIRPILITKYLITNYPARRTNLLCRNLPLGFQVDTSS